MVEPREHVGDQRGVITPVVDDRGTARAFWLRAPGCGEIRPVTLPAPGPDDVLVRTLCSGVSRGTETLVFRGGVPPRPARRRCARRSRRATSPARSSTATSTSASSRRGRPSCAAARSSASTRTRPRYVVPAAAVTLVPDGVPPARAVLAGTVETAVNALWDAAPLVGDRIAVVGAGMVGCCVARLLRRFPGVAGQAGRRRPGRGATSPPRSASTSPCPADARRRLRPRRARQRHRGRAAALARPARAGGHGHRAELVRRRARSGSSLGGAFHSGRLTIRTSQVGTVSPARAAAPHDGRPAGAGARPAARPGLRRAAHRRVAASTSCPR